MISPRSSILAAYLPPYLFSLFLILSFIRNRPPVNDCRNSKNTTHTLRRKCLHPPFAIANSRCIGYLVRSAPLSVGDLKWRLWGRFRAEVSGWFLHSPTPGKAPGPPPFQKSRLTVAGNPKLMVALASLNLPATRLHATCFSKKDASAG